MPRSTAPKPEPTLYFAFGSNLWLSQMATRCPSSPYLGIALLQNYTWIINERGYANVIPSSSPTDHVYGLVFSLSPADEAQLDKNEGVPIAYTKEYLPVDFWAAQSETERIDVTDPSTQIGREMLVYIDRKRITPSTPKEEYVYRINRGVEDAVRLGVPEEYVEGAVRRFIPAQETNTKEVEEVARKQAGGFVDEELGVDGGR